MLQIESHLKKRRKPQREKYNQKENKTLVTKNECSEHGLRICILKAMGEGEVWVLREASPCIGVESHNRREGGGKTERSSVAFQIDLSGAPVNPHLNLSMPGKEYHTPNFHVAVDRHTLSGPKRRHCRVSFRRVVAA